MKENTADSLVNLFKALGITDLVLFLIGCFMGFFSLDGTLLSIMIIGIFFLNVFAIIIWLIVVLLFH